MSNSGSSNPFNAYFDANQVSQPTFILENHLSEPFDHSVDLFQDISSPDDVDLLLVALSESHLNSQSDLSSYSPCQSQDITSFGLIGEPTNLNMSTSQGLEDLSSSHVDFTDLNETNHSEQPKILETMYVPLERNEGNFIKLHYTFDFINMNRTIRCSKADCHASRISIST
jgi:hypothetical protein